MNGARQNRNGGGEGGGGGGGDVKDWDMPTTTF